jgi:hypothetical protein
VNHGAKTVDPPGSRRHGTLQRVVIPFDLFQRAERTNDMPTNSLLNEVATTSLTDRAREHATALPALRAQLSSLAARVSGVHIAASLDVVIATRRTVTSTGAPQVSVRQLTFRGCLVIATAVALSAARIARRRSK